MNNFTPLSWYSNRPSVDDQLYEVVRYMSEEVAANVNNQIMDEHNIEKKENAGQST